MKFKIGDRVIICMKGISVSESYSKGTITYENLREGPYYDILYSVKRDDGFEFVYYPENLEFDKEYYREEKLKELGI